MAKKKKAKSAAPAEKTEKPVAVPALKKNRPENKPAKKPGKSVPSKKQAKKAKPKAKQAFKPRHAKKPAGPKPKAKPASKKPAPRKKRGKPAKPRAPTVQSLDSLAGQLSSRIAAVRKSILQNELVLRAKISEKSKVEAELSSLLRKSFSKEKTRLSRIKISAARRQAGLKQTISSLERINRIYDEKKARIRGARKKQASLKRQLALLEKQAGGLG